MKEDAKKSETEDHWIYSSCRFTDVPRRRAIVTERRRSGSRRLNLMCKIKSVTGGPVRGRRRMEERDRRGKKKGKKLKGEEGCRDFPVSRATKREGREEERYRTSRRGFRNCREPGGFKGGGKLSGRKIEAYGWNGLLTLGGRPDRRVKKRKIAQSNRLPKNGESKREKSLPGQRLLPEKIAGKRGQEKGIKEFERFRQRRRCWRNWGGGTPPGLKAGTIKAIHRNSYRGGEGKREKFKKQCGWTKLFTEGEELRVKRDGKNKQIINGEQPEKTTRANGKNRHERRATINRENLIRNRKLNYRQIGAKKCSDE